MGGAVDKVVKLIVFTDEFVAVVFDQVFVHAVGVFEDADVVVLVRELGKGGLV